jgi:hypothetical protein
MPVTKKRTNYRRITNDTFPENPKANDYGRNHQKRGVLFGAHFSSVLFKFIEDHWE